MEGYCLPQCSGGPVAAKRSFPPFSRFQDGADVHNTRRTAQR